MKEKVINEKIIKDKIMIKKEEQFIKNALGSLNKISFTNEQQKSKIKSNILNTVSTLQDERRGIKKIQKFIVTYPWRFAFGTATVQAVICALVFGTNYSNFIWSIGG